MMEWISVKDRLPSDSQDVLCVYANGVRTDVIFCYDKKRWERIVRHHYDHSDYWEVDDEVTHWMPLPEPPKEE